MGVIIFNGISSVDRDIFVETPPAYELPEKDYETIHVPGRNGDIFVDKGSYKNVKREYSIAACSFDERYDNFLYSATQISSWLHSAAGYARLEDSYEPDYYRLASFCDSGNIENIFGRAGKATIEFDCAPQRFLKFGERTFSFSASGSIFNPTIQKAKPIITVYGDGDGALTIGAYSVSISSISESITINSEIGDAYKGSTNLNSSVTLSNDFPVLVPGTNNISFSGGITSVSIVPKWWTL